MDIVVTNTGIRIDYVTLKEINNDHQLLPVEIKRRDLNKKIYTKKDPKVKNTLELKDH